MQLSHILLRAGPIRLKFADGELRYLCVGSREIARRILFVVRDHHWNTALPSFSKMEVQQTEDSFRIEIEARCVIPTVDYEWSAIITGTAQGVITFAASGAPGRDFQSNRIGICLLFGAESLAGLPFDVLDSGGGARAGEFPHLVSPTLLAENFSRLHCQIDSDMAVGVDVGGALFSMEDQRNYADTSYKAYAPLPYAYPAAPSGMRLEQVLRLEVIFTAAGANRDKRDKRDNRNKRDKSDLQFEVVPTVTGAPLFSPSENVIKLSVPVRAPSVPVHSSLPQSETTIRLGGLIGGARVPKMSRSDGAREVDFYAINTQRQLYQDAATIQFACNPALHLPDDDTFMENVSAVLDQVRTVRSFAPGAKIRIDPVTFNSQHPRSHADPRNGTAFGAAWSAAVLKYFSLAGVDEAAFAVDGELARAVQEEIGAYAGCGILESVSEAAVRPQVEVLAIAANDSVRLWLINMTDSPQRAVVFQRENPTFHSSFDLGPYAVLARELLPPSP